MKHVKEVIPSILGYSEVKEKVAVLANDVKTALNHFQALHESTIDRVRDAEARIPSSTDIVHQALEATAPLKARVSQLESMTIHTSRIEHLESDYNGLFAKVELLIDDAKKGKEYRDVMEPEMSFA